MKSYPKYKDSGIAWIGEMPEHWERKKLKYISNTQPSNVDKKSKENESEVLLCNYVDVYKNDFITDRIAFMKATASEQQIERFKLREGDVLVTKDSEDPKDIAIPALVMNDYDNVVCGYHLTRIRPFEELAGDYIFRVFQAKPFNTFFETNAKGVTRYGLGTEVFLNFEITHPPLPEQTQIARFLDRKTTQIDAALDQHRQLLQLLREERAALINEAVTKGIDPEVAMKDSGVEWIGEVPGHWEVTAYKRITTRVVVGIAEAATGAYSDNGTPILRATNVKDGKIRGSLKFINEELVLKNQSKTLRLNDILTVRTGYPGKSAVITEAFDGAQCFTMLISSLKSGQSSEFFNYLLNSSTGEAYFDLTAWGSAQKNISVPILQEMSIAIPPINEQHQIVQHIEARTTRIDREIAATEKEIALLEEYRQALIAEAVTGKIDVRDYPLD
ncbi:MAG: restriction endonuclease subunit S [Bacteroidota bacterium]